MMNRGNKNVEDFKYLIDSRNLTNKEKVEEREAILKARAARFEERSESEIKNAKLMQLKYQIKDYIDNLIDNRNPSFSAFLKVYVDTLYKKRKDFAADINIEAISLSHILNEHREPNESFLKKLIKHSQSSFNELGGFDKELWPMISFWDKTSRFLNSLDNGNVKKTNLEGKASIVKFEINKDRAGKFRFNLKAGNHQVILSSQGYATKAACENAIKSVRKNSKNDKMFHRKKAKDGSPYFSLISSNGQVIGRSEMYSSNSSMSKGIASVKKNASKAKIENKT